MPERCPAAAHDSAGGAIANDRARQCAGGGFSVSGERAAGGKAGRFGGAVAFSSGGCGGAVAFGCSGGSTAGNGTSGGCGRQTDVPAGRAAFRPQSARRAAPGQTAASLRRSAAAKHAIRCFFPRADYQSSSVIGADGTIYVANFPGMLFALRDSPSAPDQLEVAWRFHPPASSSLHATPALSGDGSTVYLAFASGSFNSPSPRATLYALKAPASGIDPQVVWTVDLGATRVAASPTVGPDGTIYIASAMGELFAVASTGNIKWMTQTEATLKSAPALAADGTVYHATSDGKMYAVSSQGQVKWTFDFGAHLGPTPLLTAEGGGPGGGGGASGIGSGASPTIGQDGTIYIGANNSNVYAVAPDGSMKWLFEAERELAGIWTTPALSADGSTLYFGANKGGVYALNAATGSRKWQFAVYGSIYASSVLDNRGVLYTGTTIEHVYAIDGARGEQIWDTTPVTRSGRRHRFVPTGRSRSPTAAG